MTIHVCSLSRLASTVEATGARHMVTLINERTPVERPAGIAVEDHLFLGMNDIVAPMDGYVAPADEHVARLLSFVNGWWTRAGRETPLVIHCWAGISRSTAGAFIAACALNPAASERDLAETIREKSPSATPNARLVALADHMMARQGRMIDAIGRIGRGRDAYEGEPFSLSIGA